jgi:hypothetical protein
VEPDLILLVWCDTSEWERPVQRQHTVVPAGDVELRHVHQEEDRDVDCPRGGRCAKPEYSRSATTVPAMADDGMDPEAIGRGRVSGDMRRQ